MRVEHFNRQHQRTRRPGEIAHRQRYFGFRNDASCASQFLMSPETARGTFQKLAGARVLTELGHGNTAQGQRRRIVSQRYSLEGTERITGSEGACGRSD
jgi:hypothetical protein